MIVKLTNGTELPVENHKVRIVQKCELVPADQRLKAIKEGGYNTFLLRSRDIFMDMLTDSGTNAMSDNQLAAMMVSDDAYAGSESFYKLSDAVEEIFGFKYSMPVHQGRAAEHLLAKVFVKPGDVIPMNYHFTTTRAHFELCGGTVLEIFTDDALITESEVQFKGNMDLKKLQDVINKYGREKISFVRMEATTNLIGGQPFSMQNMRDVKEIATKNNIPVVIDCSLISENAYFIHKREKGYAIKSIKEIIQEMMTLCDIMYLSGRKSCSVRGGLIATNNKDYYDQILPLLPLFEGFATYGGMSTKEVEAMAVGMREMVDVNVAGSSAELIRYFVARLVEKGVPVVTPAGGLACHVDAMKFVDHIPQLQYPAGALTAAIYLTSGIRSMERGTVSMDRDKDGKELVSDLELARLAVPRRVYSLSHIEYAADRLKWLYDHRKLIGGLTFVQEPPVLRFFFGRMEAIDNWGQKLVDAYKNDFGEI
jgi:tyrosine phenol-lyase